MKNGTMNTMAPSKSTADAFRVARNRPRKKPRQPHSGCLSGVVLSYSLISLADQAVLSGKRHAGVVVR